MTGCADYLSAKEDLYQAILSAAQLLANGSKIFSPPFEFAAAADARSILGCCMHVNPDGLMLTEFPIDVTEQLLLTLGACVPTIRRVTGPPKVAAAVTRNLEMEGAVKAREEARWNVFRVDKEQLLERRTEGKLRLASQADVSLVRHWGEIYQAEKPAPVSVPEYFARKLAEGNLYLWERGHPRALVATSSRSRRGIKLSAVFTPPEERKKGYASAAVSSACKVLLNDDLEFVVLATIANTATENIYQKIGFYKIGERHSFTLDRT